MYNKYNLTFRLITEMLGTNPRLPDIREKHIITKSNELIDKFNRTKGAMSRFSGAEKIPKQTIEQELEDHLRTIEAFIGHTLSDEERELLLTDSKTFFANQSDQGPAVTCFFFDPEKKKPFLRGYMLKGFLKSASEALFRASGKKKEKGESSGIAKWMDSISANKTLLNQLIGVSYKIECDTDIARNLDGTPQCCIRSLRAGDRVSIASSEYIKENAIFNCELTLLGETISEKIMLELLEYGKLISGLGQWRNAGHGLFEVVEFKKIK